MDRGSAVTAAIVVRPARAQDAARLADIWNHEARATLATTDTEPRDLAAQRAWLAAHSSPRYPVVVAVLEEAVVGYAALSPYRAKPAFTRTAEDSVYVD